MDIKDTEEYKSTKNLLNKITMKQETLEEAAERIAYNSTEENKGFPSIKMFIQGAKWQQERSYSEEEVLDILENHTEYLNTFIFQYIDREDIEENKTWFEQFKKKYL